MNQIILSLILISTVSITSIDVAYAEDKIGIFTLNSQISTTDDILVTGFVNVDSSYKPVRLEVYDPNGDLLYRPDVYFNDNGQFSWLFHPPLGKFDLTGTYTVIASHQEISETDELKFTVNERLVERTLASSIAYSNPTDTKSKSESISDESENNQQSKNESIQTNSKIISESPIFAIYLVVILVGIIIAVVVWMRKTYEKPLTQ